MAELPDQTVSHMVEGPRPGNEEGRAHKSGEPLLHDTGGLLGEGEQKDPGGGNAAGEKVGGPVGEDPGLAAAGACQDQGGTVGGQYGGSLFFVEV